MHTHPSIALSISHRRRGLPLRLSEAQGCDSALQAEGLHVSSRGVERSDTPGKRPPLPSLSLVFRSPKGCSCATRDRRREQAFGLHPSARPRPGVSLGADASLHAPATFCQPFGLMSRGTGRAAMHDEHSFCLSRPGGRFDRAGVADRAHRHEPGPGRVALAEGDAHAQRLAQQRVAHARDGHHEVFVLEIGLVGRLRVVAVVPRVLAHDLCPGMSLLEGRE